MKQDSTGVKKNNGFCFDTCTQINIFKNPNIGNFLACRWNVENSSVFVPEITLVEAQRKGFDKSAILQTLSKTLGAKIIVASSTPNMKIKAIELEQKIPLLHNGDSEILTFALETHTNLVTYDKGLRKCCEAVGVNSIDPTKIMLDVMAA